MNHWYSEYFLETQNGRPELNTYNTSIVIVSIAVLNDAPVNIKFKKI